MWLFSLRRFGLKESATKVMQEPGDMVGSLVAESVLVLRGSEY